jgi:hypothetical protein
MSNRDPGNERAYQQGRADAARGSDNPPDPTIAEDLFASVEAHREKQIQAQHWREGHADKKREMEQEKKDE